MIFDLHVAWFGQAADNMPMHLTLYITFQGSSSLGKHHALCCRSVTRVPIQSSVPTSKVSKYLI